VNEHIPCGVDRPVGIFTGDIFQHALVFACTGNERFYSESQWIIFNELVDFPAQFKVLSHVFVSTDAIFGDVLRGQVDDLEFRIRLRIW
jgi:hypothetical protein